MQNFLFSFLSFLSLSASAVTFDYDQRLESEDLSVLKRSVEEAMGKMPAQFHQSLPKTVKIRVADFKGEKTMPTTICRESAEDEDEKPRKISFLYGRYHYASKTFTLNRAVLAELKKGKANSPKLNCRHKSLYDQAIATIIHELGHAYDKDWQVSKDKRFIQLAGFGKGLFKYKNGNRDPLRSVDEYETHNLKEAFAVNLEYFSLDPEYACRKPAMFAFFKRHFGGLDPHPHRKCRTNYTVMMTTNVGAVPYKIDPAQLYRVDYLLAAPGKDISSKFGHSMYRLVMCAPERHDVLTGKTIKATPRGPKCLEDRLYHLVLSYRANSGDAPLDYFKGLMGGYPSLLFVLNFSDVLDEYNKGELRDVVSYPMKFKEEEKIAFLNRMMEEHWNYSGSYKFITNNCAVESLKLVKSDIASHRRETGGKKGGLLPKVTPVQLKHVLSKANLIDLNDPLIEKFSSRSEHLINAFNSAYGLELANTKQSMNQLRDFALTSTPEERLEKFHSLQARAKIENPSYDELRQMKADLLRTASFSVVEQQVVRMKAGQLKKKLSEFTSDKKNLETHPELKDLSDKSKKTQLTMGEISGGGYGVPLETEVISTEKLQERIKSSLNSSVDVEGILKGLFPEEIAEFDKVLKNLRSMNEHSASQRKDFRLSLARYMQAEINRMAGVAGEAGLLETALESPEAMALLRERLGKELITANEVSNETLKKLIRKSQESIL